MKVNIKSRQNLSLRDRILHLVRIHKMDQEAYARLEIESGSVDLLTESGQLLCEGLLRYQPRKEKNLTTLERPIHPLEQEFLQLRVLKELEPGPLTVKQITDNLGTTNGSEMHEALIALKKMGRIEVGKLKRWKIVRKFRRTQSYYLKPFSYHSVIGYYHVFNTMSGSVLMAFDADILIEGSEEKECLERAIELQKWITAHVPPIPLLQEIMRTVAQEAS